MKRLRNVAVRGFTYCSVFLAAGRMSRSDHRLFLVSSRHVIMLYCNDRLYWLPSNACRVQRGVTLVERVRVAINLTVARCATS